MRLEQTDNPNTACRCVQVGTIDGPVLWWALTKGLAMIIDD